MSRQKVRPEELAIAIIAELENYQQEVTDAIKADVKETAKECVKEIKMKAPVRTGEYKRGWKYEIEYESNTDIRVRVYNSAKPKLTHLLEFGHASRNGGRVPGIQHIAPAEKNAVKKLEKKARVTLQAK